MNLRKMFAAIHESLKNGGQELKVTRSVPGTPLISKRAFFVDTAKITLGLLTGGMLLDGSKAEAHDPWNPDYAWRPFGRHRFTRWRNYSYWHHNYDYEWSYYVGAHPKAFVYEPGTYHISSYWYPRLERTFVRYYDYRWYIYSTPYEVAL